MCPTLLNRLIPITNSGAQHARRQDTSFEKAITVNGSFGLLNLAIYHN